MIEIKKAGVWDCAAIADMWLLLMQETEFGGLKLPTDGQEITRFFKALVFRIDQPATLAYIAMDKYRPVGYILGSVEYWAHTVNLVAHCEGIYVTKKERNKGLDKKLIEAFTKDAVTNKRCKAGIFQSPHQEAWKKQGYKPILTIFQITKEDFYDGRFRK